MCIYTCNKFMKIFAFKNNPTHSLNNTENQRPSLRKKESLIPLPNFKLEYGKTTLSFLPLGNLQSYSLSFPHEKLNPNSASTAIPTPQSFLSKSDFSSGPVHRMVSLLSRKKRRKGQKACYHGGRKGEKMDRVKRKKYKYK